MICIILNKVNLFRLRTTNKTYRYILLYEQHAHRTAFPYMDKVST